MPKGKILQNGAVGGRPPDFDKKLKALLTDDAIHDSLEESSDKKISKPEVNVHSEEIRVLLSDYVAFHRTKQLTEGQLKSHIKLIETNASRLLSALNTNREEKWVNRLYEEIQCPGVVVWDNLHKKMRRLGHSEGFFDIKKILYNNCTSLTEKEISYLSISLPILLDACEQLKEQTFCTPYQNGIEAKFVPRMANIWEELTRFSASQRYPFDNSKGEINWFTQWINSLFEDINSLTKLDNSTGKEEKRYPYLQLEGLTTGRIRDILDRSPFYEGSFNPHKKSKNRP